MLSVDEHSEIVAKLYASVTGETAWSTTLAQFADRFSSKAALIQISDAAFTRLTVENHGYSREFADSYYASEAYANDPRVAYYRNVKLGSIYFDHCLYSVDEMDRNSWCQESYQLLGAKYQLGTVLPLPNGSIGALAILSSEKEGHASREAIGAFRRLAPHIEQAMSLGYVFEHHVATQAALLNALADKADGVVMLGGNGTPTFMNDAATRIFERADGLNFRCGSIAAYRGPENRRLNEIIASAIAASRDTTIHPGGQMLITRSSGLRPYIVRAMPTPMTERFVLATEAAACVIHIHDLSAIQLPPLESLRAIFGLTERESHLVIELIRCTDLSAAAAAAGMALNTARNHLQSIFRKTGTTKQSEAMQLLNRIR
jgi:DNA-binding CsgD family transcriptional regulator